MKRSLAGLWHRCLRYAGPAGIGGILLFMLGALIAASLPHLRQQGRALRLEVDAVSARAPEPGSARTRPRLPADRQVSELIAGFPLLSQNPDDLEEVFLSARRRNITLLRGEYQFKPDAKAPLMTYTATFPVRSDYVSIRNFTADVLRALPHASLEELHMNRSDSGSSVIESMIRFNFVYRRS